jgi:hypothetical protein
MLEWISRTTAKSTREFIGRINREEILKMVSMNPVVSSNIGAIGYDGVTRELHVQFKSGRTYKYSNVPLDVYDAFLAAESKGKYFAANVRGKYEFSMM